VLASGWLTQGPEVEAFEHEVAGFVGAPHACAVSSGSAALLLALEAVGVGPGSEVVTVSHSFIATVDAVRLAGATPVYVDPATFNIDPTLVEPALSSRTAAVLCVHQMGMPADLTALLEITDRHGLPLVEDAACAAGAEIHWRGGWERVGRPRGAAVCFSFHPRKLLTTGDGGMVTTTDAAVDGAIRRRRSHGMSVPAHDRHVAGGVRFETYDEPGFNFRMSDLGAAVGRVQLRRLDHEVARRRVLADRYRSLLAGVAGVTAPVEPAWARSNWQSWCVRLDDRLEQRHVMERLLDAGVASRRGVMCAHRERAYPPGTWRPGSQLANGEAAQDRCVLLPLYGAMTDADQDVVVAALAEACGP
jgi:perosamine synthetase